MTLFTRATVAIPQDSPELLAPQIDAEPDPASPLQIVRAFSEVKISEAVYERSNVARLVKSLEDTSANVRRSNDDLSQLRTEKANQSLFAALNPFAESVSDKIEEKHLALNQQVAILGQHSAELLVVNTALSKVLCGQQRLLLDQQGALASQAEDIKKQNLRIESGQRQVAEFQARHLSANDAWAQRAVSLAERLEVLALRVTTFEEAVTSAHTRTLEVVEARLEELQDEVNDVQQELSKAVDGWLSNQQEAERHRQSVQHSIEAMRNEQQREMTALASKFDAVVADRAAIKAHLAMLAERLSVFRWMMPIVATIAGATASFLTWFGLRS